MTVIHNYDDLITKNMVIKNSIVFSEKYRIKNIKYKSKCGEFIEQENLYIQTPYFYLRYLPSSIEGSIDNKITLDLYFNIKKSVKKIKVKDKMIESEEEDEYDIELKKFYDCIKKIHKSLKTKLIKKEGKKIKKPEKESDVIQNVKGNHYIDVIKERDTIDKDNKTYSFKTKIHSLNGNPYFRIYYSNKKLAKEQKLKINTLTRFIIHLESIWFFEDSYGFNWYITQAEMKLPNILNTYSFHNDFIEESELYHDNNNDRKPRILPNIPPPPPIFNPPTAPVPPPIPSLKNSNDKSSSIIKAPIIQSNNEIQIDARIPTKNQLLEQLSKLRKVEKKE